MRLCSKRSTAGGRYGAAAAEQRRMEADDGTVEGGRREQRRGNVAVEHICEGRPTPSRTLPGRGRRR